MIRNNLFRNIDNPKNRKCLFIIAFCDASADGLALLGSRTSITTVDSVQDSVHHVTDDKKI